MERYREIEKNLIKKFRKTIWTKFVHAVKDYKLIEENDKIAVCISGGKDSMLLAKCMQELQRHGQFKFELEFITMDPGYHQDSIKEIEENAKLLNIPIKIFKTDVFEVVSKYAKKEPCYLCARMRRGHLYNKAKELGCNKIALAHHMDDAIETIMMNIFYNGRFGTMMPKLKSTNYEGMQLIRPLYYVNEEDIIAFIKANDLYFMDCGCMITVCASSSKRFETKELIAELKKNNPDIGKNIFKSSSNVVMDTIIGYKKGNTYYSFLDDFE
ncbi:MAG: ATP-binding protein [Bacilli bacterium]|nr:ATP-binding protein [Bacilli bacterium]MDD3305237.1 ATP-binding protein [Bacilli bacterium]MDD4053928.1 ATP-binding protein [Bacilli bacterium]MDD4411687.1 ATP-binding protein [Bacilli bacterium]